MAETWDDEFREDEFLMDHNTVDACGVPSNIMGQLGELQDESFSALETPS